MADDPTVDPTQQRDAVTQDPEAESTDDLGESGRKALDAERKARRDAERRAKAIEQELAGLKADAQKRADAEAAEQGEWKTLAERREADLTTVTSERDALNERLTTLEKLAADRLESLVKGLPKELADLGPGDDTPIEARLEWAEKATKAAEKVTGKPGNGPNPPPAGGFDRNAALNASRKSGKFHI